MQADVKEMLQTEAPVKPEVQHLLQLLVEETGLDAIGQKL